MPRTIINPPSAATVRELLDAARNTDEVLHCWLQVAVATGARGGELCALRRCDFDLTARTVRIGHSVSATKAHGIFIKTTKTGREVQPADLVFTNDPTAQRPWRPALVTRRWERLRAQTGHRGVRIHDLRHFVATELLTAGINIRTVANRLGHARTSTTLDIYWAWVPARDRDAAEHLEGLLVPVVGPAALTTGAEDVAADVHPATTRRLGVPHQSGHQG